MPGSVCRVRLQGTSVTVVAGLDESVAGGREPITEELALELASGSDQNPTWPRPVAIHAVVVTGQDATRTVRRVSRWASYTSRVAVVPSERLSDGARVEAMLRGIWLVATGRPPQIVIHGEAGPTPGSERGLRHRLLDELVFEALIGERVTSRKVKPAASAATRSAR